MSHEYTLIVYTDPADGREDEYNAWYDDVHLPEFTALPGVINGRRFKVAVEDYPEFRAAVKGLVKQGQLEVAKDKTLRKPDLTMAVSIVKSTVFVSPPVTCTLACCAR